MKYARGGATVSIACLLAGAVTPALADPARPPMVKLSEVAKPSPSTVAPHATASSAPPASAKASAAATSSAPPPVVPVVLPFKPISGANVTKLKAVASVKTSATNQWSGQSVAVSEDGGLVYVDAYEVNPDTSAHTATVKAYHTADGSTAWSATVVSQFPLSSPAVGNGNVYVIGDRLTALDGATGQARWSKDVLAVKGPQAPSIGGSTTNMFDTWLVGGGGAVYVSSDGVVYALDASTGAGQWSANVGTQTGPLAFDATSFYLGAYDGGTRSNAIKAFDRASKANKWQLTPVRGLDHTLPGVQNGVVFQTGSAGIYALDAKTGNIVWKTGLPNGITGSSMVPLLVSGGMVYVVGETAYSAYVYAFGASDGSSKWHAEVPGANRAYVPPVVVNGVLFLGGSKVYAFDAATGAPPDGATPWTFSPAHDYDTFLGLYAVNGNALVGFSTSNTLYVLGVPN